MAFVLMVNCVGKCPDVISFSLVWHSEVVLVQLVASSNDACHSDTSQVVQAVHSHTYPTQIPYHPL